MISISAAGIHGFLLKIPAKEVEEGMKRLLLQLVKQYAKEASLRKDFFADNIFEMRERVFHMRNL